MNLFYCTMVFMNEEKVLESENNPSGLEKSTLLFDCITSRQKYVNLEAQLAKEALWLLNHDIIDDSYKDSILDMGKKHRISQVLDTDLTKTSDIGYVGQYILAMKQLDQSIDSSSSEECDRLFGIIESYRKRAIEQTKAVLEFFHKKYI